MPSAHQQDINTEAPQQMNSQHFRHSFSMKWQAPKYKANNENKRANLQLNEARRKICRNSPFWPKDLDLDEHKKEWRAGESRRAQHLQDTTVALATEQQRRKDTNEPPLIIAPARPAFSGKTFAQSRSTILSEWTIFCPQWRNEKDDIADWPSKHEMEYEGDGRIATDRLHRRFPGTPRVAGNETINWQHRAVIPPFPFDDFYFPIPTAVDVFMRTHVIAELEFSDSEGEEAVGGKLMGLLDPLDQW